MQNEIIGIIGRKGSGKSRRFRSLIRTCPRLILFDPLSEHTWCPNATRTVERLHDFLFKHAADGRKSWAGRYIPQGEPRRDFEPFGAMVYERGHVTLGVEEVGLISAPNSLPANFDRIVRLGRHKGINLVWTSQRIAEVSKRLTSATDRFFIFRHTEPRDLDALEDRCGTGVADRVAKLGLHDFIEFDVLSGEIVEPHSSEPSRGSQNDGTSKKPEAGQGERAVSRE